MHNFFFISKFQSIHWWVWLLPISITEEPPNRFSSNFDWNLSRTTGMYFSEILVSRHCWVPKLENKWKRLESRQCWVPKLEKKGEIKLSKLFLLDVSLTDVVPLVLVLDVLDEEGEEVEVGGHRDPRVRAQHQPLSRQHLAVHVHQGLNLI